MPTPGASLQDISRHLIKHATSSDDGASLIEDCCTALVGCGLPLAWLSLAIRTIEPETRGLTITWRPGKRVVLEESGVGQDDDVTFKLAPIRHLLAEGRRFGHWRLDGSAKPQPHPLLTRLRSEGITDYALHIVDFAPGTALIGAGIAIASDAPGGFTEEGLAAFDVILPALALAVSKLSLSRTLRQTLSTYLGPQTASRVLDGQIRRGEGRTISAALLLTDLRGFTALSEREDPLRVVAWLDEHFEALGEPVERFGGEILKFLGDGFLAVFPAPDDAGAPCIICDAALDAATSALSRNRALNRHRRLSGLPVLEADLVLHFGRVVYGNIGTSRRLDFTVIGAAVNEASRIEKLCEQTGNNLLMSDSFAERSGRGLVPIGRFPLRGLEIPRQVWTMRGGPTDPGI